MKPSPPRFRSLLLLSLVAMLSPMMRLLPRLPAALAGRAAWLSPLLAALPALLYVPLLAAGFRGGPGGLARLRAAWGKGPGRVLALLLSLWLTLVLAFGIRASAERILSTVYAAGRPWAFCLALAALAVIGARGGLAPLCRAAAVLGLVLLLGVAPLLLPALGQIRAPWLWPVLPRDLPGALAGAAPVLGLMTQPMYFSLMADEAAPGDRRTALLFTLLGLGLALVTVVSTVGGLSPALAAALQHPFFIMIRGVRLFGALERMEAVVLGLWVMSDFVCLSGELLLLCRLASDLGLGERKTLAPPLGLLAWLLALALGPRALGRMEPLALAVMAGNLAVTALLLPLTNARAKQGRPSAARAPADRGTM